jgi:CheY-like chemotaxis protein
VKILLVDDDPDAVLLTSFVLEAAGWEVVSFADGADAIKAVSCEKPDMVLLDFLLPDLDGAEILRRLREQPENDRIPVIFLTGKEQPELAADLLRQGAQGVLHKPINPEQLAQEVGQIFEESRFSGKECS